MLCSECGKNPATVHLMQSVNGVKTERHLCAECARKHPELQMSFANVGLGAFGAENLFQKFFNFRRDSIGISAPENHIRQETLIIHHSHINTLLRSKYRIHGLCQSSRIRMWCSINNCTR